MGESAWSKRERERCLADIFVNILINPLTTLNLQRTGLGVQREAAQIHVAHGSDSDSTGKTPVTQRKMY